MPRKGREIAIRRKDIRGDDILERVDVIAKRIKTGRVKAVIMSVGSKSGRGDAPAQGGGEIRDNACCLERGNRCTEEITGETEIMIFFSLIAG